MTRSSPTLLRLLGPSGVVVSLMAQASLVALAACSAEDAATASAGPGSGSGPTAPAGVGGSTGEGGSGGGTSSLDDVLHGPCALGASRECKVHNDAGCLGGRQYCVDGVWSDCVRHVTRGMTHRALTDGAEDCGETSQTTANNCDAGCKAIPPEEIPDFAEGSTSIIDWLVGVIGDLPLDAIDEGLIEPCDSDRDCEFDHYCNEVTGLCSPYAPGQTNPACGTDYDVTAGIPCDDQVIICNRGGSPIPEATLESMEIKYREPGNPIAANTYWMDGCALGGADGECAIAVDGPLEPGECVGVPCAVPVGYTVFVDAGAGNSEECECGNNWTVNPGGECSEPLCGGDIATVERVPLTIFLLVDVSLSIEPHWPTIRDGVNSFLQDPANEGIGVVLKFWPTGRCSTASCDADGPYNTGGSCAFHPCSVRTGTGASNTLGSACDPTVQDMCDESAWDQCCNLGSGTKRWGADCQREYDRRSGGACTACDHGSIANTSHTLDGYRFELPAAPLVTAMNGVTDFPANTPVAEAFTGAVDYARDFMAAHPGERAVVVAPTDANYSSGVSCTPPGAATETATRAAVSDAFENDDVYTFIIGTSGLSSSARTDLDELAAEGGTGAATFLTPGGGASELSSRLQEIANSFACQYAVPDDTDPALVTVEWNHGDGTEDELTELDDVSDCGAGVLAYYYNTPTSLTLCPDTCAGVRAETDSSVEIAIQCEVTATPMTYTTEFTAEGECTEIGTFPKWTVLLYNAEVPPGSSIEVRAATKLYADDARYADPSDAVFRTEVDVVTITDANETSDLSDPTRLDTPLGSEAFGEVLRLELESTVAGGAPELLDYEVQFTCAPSE